MPRFVDRPAPPPAPRRPLRLLLLLQVTAAAACAAVGSGAEAYDSSRSAVPKVKQPFRAQAGTGVDPTVVVGGDIQQDAAAPAAGATSGAPCSEHECARARRSTEPQGDPGRSNGAWPWQLPSDQKSSTQNRRHKASGEFCGADCESNGHSHQRSRHSGSSDRHRRRSTGRNHHGDNVHCKVMVNETVISYPAGTVIVVMGLGPSVATAVKGADICFNGDVCVTKKCMGDSLNSETSDSYCHLELVDNTTRKCSPFREDSTHGFYRKDHFTYPDRNIYAMIQILADFALKRIGPHEKYGDPCPPGYYFSSDTVQCEDIDECQSGHTRCSHECKNLPGSFTCSCPTGFYLSSDMKTCQDIDECKLDMEMGHSFSVTYGVTEGGANHALNKSISLAGCSHFCTNTVGSYICSCPVGLTLAADKRTCVDVDECQLKISGCSHRCENLPGSYKCSCDPGFFLMDDGKSCDDFDECAIDASGRTYAGCSHNCTNIANGFMCSCPRGFVLSRRDLKSCILDDCRGIENSCSHICTGLEDGFMCSCPDGLVLAWDLKTCVGEDDCAVPGKELPVGHARCWRHCDQPEGEFVFCHCSLDFTWCSERRSCVPADGSRPCRSAQWLLEVGLKKLQQQGAARPTAKVRGGPPNNGDR